MQHSAWYKVSADTYYIYEAMCRIRKERRRVHSRHKIKMLSDVSRSPFLQFEETRIVRFINIKSWNSLAVQWLGLHACTAKSTGSIPGQGTTIPQVACSGAKKNGGFRVDSQTTPYTHTGTLGTYPNSTRSLSKCTLSS